MNELNNVNMKRTVLLLLAMFCAVVLSAQGTSCDSATLFCMSSNTIYPASTGVTSPAYGAYPNYGCLCTMPNPMYYYLQISSPGNIVVNISSTPAHDVDFICWGPFTSLADVCANGLTGNCNTCYSGCPNNTTDSVFYPSGNIADCSYSVNSSENCHINNALTGQLYILLVTNYSDQACNISFSQANLNIPGAGATLCGYFPIPFVHNGPSCLGDTIRLFADTIAGASYNWFGPDSWTVDIQNPIRLNATPAMSGNYICYISKDTSMLAIDTTVVAIHPNPTVTVTSDTICVGGIAKLTASGALNYIWGNFMTDNPIMVSPIYTTIYPVCGIDSNNCVGFANAKVFLYTIVPTIYQSGIVLISSSVIDNQWQLNGQSIPGAINQTYTIPVNNADTLCYTVTVTSYGCSLTSDTICILPVGILETVDKGLNIYPNPFKDELTVETTSTKEQKLEILNLIGQTVYTSVITKKAVVKTGAFPVGVYFIKLSTDKETVVKKFVKE